MPSSAFAALSWAAFVGGAAPEPPETPEATASSLSWDAPPGCPDQAAVVARVEGLLGASLTAPRAVAVAAEGAIVAEEPDASLGYVLRLQVRSDSGTRRREIAGGDCEELAQVAALLVAIAIDPGVAQEHKPAAEPEPAPEPPIEPVVEPEPEPEPASTPEPAPREVGGSIRVGGGLTLGPLPSLAGMLHVSGAVRWRWLRAEAGLSRRLARPVQTSQGTGATADIWATAGEVSVCGVPKVPWVEFPLCVGGEVGALTGRSRNVAMPATGGGLWAAARLGGGLIVLPVPRVGVVLDADLVVPISRPGFAVAGAGLLYRAAPVGLDAVIALEVRFP